MIFGACFSPHFQFRPKTTIYNISHCPSRSLLFSMSRSRGIIISRDDIETTEREKKMKQSRLKNVKIFEKKWVGIKVGTMYMYISEHKKLAHIRKR